tara:strand:+ start:1563 stop:2663 length:1101 start_codon:yes stop_codon:yes gene_type:complete
MEQIDIAIIGGGVVGLSIASALFKKGRSICLLEKHPRMGLEASTHNSGVIHAGLYYPQNTLKTKLCIEGRKLLYTFCKKYRIPHSQCGKLIVCSKSSEIPALELLATQGQSNGLEDLRLVDQLFCKKKEPSIKAKAAIWSPSTGIIEPEALVRTLTHLASQHGVALLTETCVKNGSATPHGVELITQHEQIHARLVINAAGLYADQIAKMLGGHLDKIYPVRGEYAELAPRTDLFINGLIYPLPEQSGHGLGIHLTKTTWGTVIVGPTAKYQTSKTDYEQNRLPLELFYDSARHLVPNLHLNDLKLGNTGIRATCRHPNENFSDFIIGRDLSVPTLIHVGGIDSPGLTACLAIGKMVSKLVDETLN